MDVRPIRQILCPIDFSDFSRHALDHAIAIARRYDARVTALQVFVLAVEGALFTGAAGLEPFTLNDANREQLLARMRTFVEGESGSQAAVDVIVRESNDVASQILQEALALGADLLVIGTHGRSGFDRLVLGSVTEKILRKAPCPVLTIPRRAPDAVPIGGAPYTRILCGVDFSDCSLAALSYAADFARRGAEWLGVVHAIEVPPASYEGANEYALAVLQAELEEDAKTRFAQLLPGLDGSGQFRKESIVVTDKSYRAILRIAQERGADLIVLGVHGRGVLDRMLFGSTTNHVIRQAVCPVLTIRT
jgi:nucleotide-binding universal stress UspA family protein